MQFGRCSLLAKSRTWRSPEVTNNLQLEDRRRLAAHLHGYVHIPPSTVPEGVLLRSSCTNLRQPPSDVRVVSLFLQMEKQRATEWGPLRCPLRSRYLLGHGYILFYLRRYQSILSGEPASRRRLILNLYLLFNNSIHGMLSNRPTRTYPKRSASIMNIPMHPVMPGIDAEISDPLEKALEDVIGFSNFLYPAGPIS